MKKNKFLLVFLYFFIFSFYTFADDTKKVSVSPFYSLQNGMLYEYVFATDYSSKSTQKLSELNWPINNISYAGIQLDTKFKFINFHLSYAYGFIKASGNMEDFDWQDFIFEGNKFYYNNPSLCTNKSINENYLKNANVFDFNIHFDINPILHFHILPFAGFTYNFYDFVGKNGYGWYGNKEHTHNDYNVAYSNPEAKYYPKGTLCGIEFKRNIYDVYIGFELNYLLFDRLSLSSSFAVSPFIYIYSIDFHHSDMAGIYGTYYHDLMTGYFKHFLLSEKVSFKFDKYCSLFANFDFSIQNLIYGKTYISHSSNYTNNNLTNVTFAGCEGKYWQFTTGITFTF